jgi:hypothetical protein
MSAQMQKHLHEIIRLKNLKIKELSKIKEFSDQKPIPHNPAEIEILKFKLNRAEREIARLYNITGKQSGDRKEASTQTLKSWTRKQEEFISISGVLRDLANTLGSILDSISPDLTSMMSAQGLKTSDSCTFINAALQIIQLHSTQLEEKIQDLEFKKRDVESRMKSLKMDFESLAFVYNQNSARFSQHHQSPLLGGLSLFSNQDDRY